jgi:hypothetical protein
MADIAIDFKIDLEHYLELLSKKTKKLMCSNQVLNKSLPALFKIIFYKEAENRILKILKYCKKIL